MLLHYTATTNTTPFGRKEHTTATASEASISHAQKRLDSSMPEVAVQTNFFEAEVKDFSHASEAFKDLNIGKCLDKRFAARVLKNVEKALSGRYTKYAKASDYPTILQNYPMKSHMPFTKPPKVAQMNNSANIVVFSDCYYNDPAPLERMAARLDKYHIKVKCFVKNYPQLQCNSTAYKMDLKKNKMTNSGYNVLYRGCLYGFYIKYEFPRVGDPRFGNPKALY